jgi:hypothetical protein
MKAYLSLGIWSGKIPRGAALFRQDGKGANGGYLRLRNANAAFSRPCRHQLRFCRDLKEIIDDWERQPPNLAQEPT